MDNRGVNISFVRRPWLIEPGCLPGAVNYCPPITLCRFQYGVLCVVAISWAGSGRLGYRCVVDNNRWGRFGFFATLTLPDVDGAIAEAAHAFDVLGADGVVLLASVRGTYLGDASIEPLMAELDRRAAVVFVHPSELNAPPVPGIPPFAADFLLDTTRAAIHMARAGWLERYPNLRIILSHGGGFVPYAAERIARACADQGDQTQGLARLKRYYFDTALTSSPYALPSLLAFAEPSHITFGSDWPYAPAERSQHFARLLDAYPLSDAQRAAIHRDNAAALFGRP